MPPAATAPVVTVLSRAVSTAPRCSTTAPASRSLAHSRVVRVRRTASARSSRSRAARFEQVAAGRGLGPVRGQGKEVVHAGYRKAPGGQKAAHFPGQGQADPVFQLNRADPGGGQAGQDVGGVGPVPVGQVVGGPDRGQGQGDFRRVHFGSGSHAPGGAAFLGDSAILAPEAFKSRRGGRVFRSGLRAITRGQPLDSPWAGWYTSCSACGLSVVGALRYFSAVCRGLSPPGANSRHVAQGESATLTR